MDTGVPTVVCNRVFTTSRIFALRTAVTLTNYVITVLEINHTAWSGELKPLKWGTTLGTEKTALDEMFGIPIEKSGGIELRWLRFRRSMYNKEIGLAGQPEHPIDSIETRFAIRTLGFLDILQVVMIGFIDNRRKPLASTITGERHIIILTHLVIIISTCIL